MSPPAAVRRIVQLSGKRTTGRPVRFELSEQTRQAVDDYLEATNKSPGKFLFTAILMRWNGPVPQHRSAKSVVVVLK
jgi:hypothetical protein